LSFNKPYYFRIFSIYNLKSKLYILSFFLTVLFFSTVSYSQFYQGSKQEYGKNRVQYNGFSWKNHSYKRFKIHYSGKNKELAVYVARTLHHYLNDAEDKLDYTFPEKMEVIVYESQSKFRQSNLGISNDETTELGGNSRIVGSKVFVYYPGDHQEFNKIIKGAVYEVLLKHMFYGGNWKAIVKSNLTSNMPIWLEKGLVNYFVEGWEPNVESRLKDLVLTKKVNKFNDLTIEEKTIVGQGIWNFIAENYSNSSITSILGITRVTQNVERSFSGALGLNYIELNKKCINFYQKRFIAEYKTQQEPQGELIGIKHKKESVYYSVKPNADGSKIVYVENTLGRYKVKIYDKTTQKTTRVFTAESKLDRIQDYSYPVVEWHPSGKAIGFYTERKGKVIYYFYSLDDKELTQKEIKAFDKILSFSYSPKGDKVVVSAVIDGQTDLHIYNTSGGGKIQLTNDLYDDLHPRFVNNEEVVFASNRISDTITPKAIEIDFLPSKNDIFIYPIVQHNRTFKYLTRITDSEKINEIQPFPTGINTFQFLSDENGLYNRFESNKDSSIAFIDTVTHYKYTISATPLTNSVTSIKEHFVSKDNNQLIYTLFQNSQHKIFELERSNEKIETFTTTTYKAIQNKGTNKKTLSEYTSKSDTSYLNNVYYQKVILAIGNQVVNEVGLKDTILKKIKKFKAPSYTVYKIDFAKDYMSAQLDNNFLFPTYQAYSPGSVYFNSGINALLKIGISDLFDDYKLVGGVRIPTSLNSGGEQLLMIQNLVNRVDHRLIYHRQKYVNTSSFVKDILHEVRYRISYPISELLTFRATTTIRQDKKVFIPYSDNTLNLNPLYRHTAGENLELVFDNTIPIELNIRRGNRLKIFGEALYGIENRNTTYNIGFDFRNYLRIKRNFIWVNRLAGATSLGSSRLLYYLGGVDNWVFRPDPDFNSDVDIDPSQNYGYQTIATPLRGFIQNTRNGNSFLLFTSELRLPLFTYFSTFPLKKDFFKHFQIVTFADVGSAWTGASPLSPDNYFNTQVIESNPLTISVNNLREPIVGDFGFGFRSKVWGYFIRLDFGWGVENLEIQKYKTQLSLSLDI